MFYRIYLLFLLSICQCQITGLGDWNLFIDPGHSVDENMGVSGYSEAREVLKVGLYLMDILYNQTDIDTVFIARTNDNQNVSLYQRTNYANTVGASWYHSIHSDASSNLNTNRTLLLWGQLYNGNPDPPIGGQEMSSYMINTLTKGMRIDSTGSWGDCSFYTWSDYCANSGGPYLYVNRNTNMPSELSEQGHHSNPLQNQLAMNEEYKKMVAYLLFWSILDYHNIERPFVGQLAGQIFDLETQKTINGAIISIDHFQYVTDTYESLFYEFSNDESDGYSNGFYWFNGLSDSTYEVVYDAPGYYPDTSIITILDTFITFNDIDLISSQPPYVLNSNPSEGDSLFPSWEDLEITFSRPMDTASVQNAILFSPQTDFSWHWVDNQRLIISPDTLLFETEYGLLLLDDLKDMYGHIIDGDNDGMQGGHYQLTFITGPEDLNPPQIQTIYPPDLSNNIEIFPVVNIQFDEIINIENNSLDNIYLEQLTNNLMIISDIVHYNVNNRSSVCLFPQENLNGDEIYIVRVNSGITDLFNNQNYLNSSFSFQTGLSDIEIIEIDNFETNFDFWWNPHLSGSTFGIILDSTNITTNSDIINLLYPSNHSMEVNYGWDTSYDDHLIRIYLSGGESRQIIFNSDKLLQAYIFGDGSENKIRFCVDDNVDDSAGSNHEVSPWYTIDWIGWKLVSWDMSVDEAGEWIGDGNLNGSLRFDSFQLTHSNDALENGTIFIDDLRLVNNFDLSNGIEKINKVISIAKNFPNPFNNSTKISFTIDKTRSVKINIYDIKGHKVKTIVDDHYNSGTYNTNWDGKNTLGEMVSSGIYYYSIISNDYVETKSMVYLK